MDNLEIRKKLLFLYLFCVLIPLALTDGVILFLLVRADTTKARHEMQNTAETVSYELSSMFEALARITNNICTNRSIDDFLEYQYPSNLDFYKASRTMLDSVYYDMVIGYSNAQLSFYADNDTLVNGGHFYRLSSAETEGWYREYLENGMRDDLIFYYDDSMKYSVSSQRKVSVVRRLDYFRHNGKVKLLKMNLDYSSINRKLENMKFDAHVYVCSGDRIIFSNREGNSYMEPFEFLTGHEHIGYELDWGFYGEDLRILVDEPSDTLLERLIHNLPWLLLIMTINVLFPFVLIKMVNHSFVERIRILGKAFDEIEPEGLSPIDSIRGTDEIAGLMKNYNRMLKRLQELIQIVYKDRLERQEIDLTRQTAEIQALHSQINPHFLFNTLESIRMHSVLKNEDETAEMIARLALLVRQNVKWTNDYVRLEEELKFIEAYLELQKYRFGKRLSYEIEVSPECLDAYLPRLTLSTLVENACVHGIEGKKVSCWIYIRVYQKDGWLYLEIEDTGSGMSEEATAALLVKMRTCDIHMLKESSHIGILNVCLRLKLFSDSKVEFEVESEEGAGSLFVIRMPMEKVLREEIEKC